MVPDYPVAPLLDFTLRPLRSVHRLKADKQENRTAETEAKNLQAASQARGRQNVRHYRTISNAVDDRKALQGVIKRKT